jgi:hypothetical protein
VYRELDWRWDATDGSGRSTCGKASTGLGRTALMSLRIRKSASDERETSHGQPRLHRASRGHDQRH